MERQLIVWQYCSNPNDVNDAILHEDPNWEGLKSASQIINITFNPSHGCYVVFWRVDDDLTKDEEPHELSQELSYGAKIMNLEDE